MDIFNLLADLFKEDLFYFISTTIIFISCFFVVVWAPHIFIEEFFEKRPKSDRGDPLDGQ